MLSPVWLCKPMDCSLPDSFICGSFQARTLECCHFLLQGIFLSQGLNLNLLHWKADSLPLHHLGSPWNISSVLFSSVQSLSHVWLFATPWSAAHQASLSITNARSLLKLMSIELVMPSNLPLSSPSAPAFTLSQHQSLFKWVSSSHQVAKVSASTSVLSVNIQDWFCLGWTGWVSLLSKGLCLIITS